ncbi:transposable element Tc3 transposase [Trichonephila clavipes]|nr:transposable element Tc3 transposase [Trichonephila clavipes]
MFEKISVLLDGSTRSPEELIEVDDDNVCTAPIMTDKDIMRFVQSSKNLIEVDFDYENEMNITAPVPPLSEMRNIMKCKCSYSDAHSNGELNNEMDAVEQLVDNLMRKKYNFDVWSRNYVAAGISFAPQWILINESEGFVEWAQNEIAVVPDFHKRILFCDEAHFWLNGYVNKQNCRIWSEPNPQVYVETPLHPEKLTVWCALWAGGIIGPYFFKNDEGHNVTVNGDRYRAMITNFFIPELSNHDVQELWFQQDGATCHTARAPIDLLKDTFGDRLISRFGPVYWPPRSCDLTSLEYFLWGYVKSVVYADKSQALDHLEDSIRRVIADIRPQMLEKVIEN